MKRLRKPPNWELWVVLAVAFALRVVWILTRTSVIENEGAEYCRIAQNLLNGAGYAGNEEGPQIYYGPLFPLLIAATSLIVRNPEVAGRVVVLVSGTCLVIAAYVISRYVYGRRVAIISAGLIAVHPLFVGFSATVYNETLYLAVLMAAIYWALRSLQLESFKHSVLAGIWFGLCYLSRVEALALPFLTCLALLAAALMGGASVRRALQSGMCVLVVFAILAAPYVAYLSRQLGHFSLEAKSRTNYTIGRRMNLGMNSSEAQLGINSSLEQEGPLLNPIRFANYSPYAMTFAEVVRYMVRSAFRNKGILYHDILPAYALGSPLLLGLAVLGLFGKAWDRRRLINEGYVVVVAGFLALVVVTAHYIQFRYVLPLLPIIVIWASAGIAHLADWTMNTLVAVGLPSAFSSVAGWGACALSGGLLVAFAGVGVFYVRVNDFEAAAPNVLSIKEAGLWLKNHCPGSKRIMDSGSVLSYYAGGTMIYLPHTESSIALRYIESKRPDFVIVSDFASGARPYLAAWLKDGIPSQSPELVFQSGDKHSENRVKVYRWLASPSVSKTAPRENSEASGTGPSVHWSPR